MSHCANCQEIDRLNRGRDKAYDDRRAAALLKRRVEQWSLGRGLLRFFLPWSYRQTMFEGACLVIADANERIAKLELDIEKAEKSTIEGELRYAERKMAQEVSKSFEGPIDRVEAIKGLAATLDADLKFEDAVKDFKSESVFVGLFKDDPRKETTADGYARKQMPLVEMKCTCGTHPDDIHDTDCRLFKPKQAHLHPGTHYEGDSCLGGHVPPEGAPLDPIPHSELRDEYLRLSTPELKTHVEAALDAAVERGISMTVGDLAKKGVGVRIKKNSPKTKR